MFERLVEANSDLDYLESKLCQSALHIAIQSNHSHLAKHLIKHKANLHYVDKNEVSPLAIACFQGNLELAQIILDSFEPAQLKGDQCATNALAIACVRGHLDEARMLVKAGVDPNLDTGKMVPLPLHHSVK